MPLHNHNYYKQLFSILVIKSLGTPPIFQYSKNNIYSGCPVNNTGETTCRVMSQKLWESVSGVLEKPRSAVVSFLYWCAVLDLVRVWDSMKTKIGYQYQWILKYQTSDLIFIQKICCLLWLAVSDFKSFYLELTEWLWQIEGNISGINNHPLLSLWNEIDLKYSKKNFQFDRNVDFIWI